MPRTFTILTTAATSILSVGLVFALIKTNTTSDQSQAALAMFAPNMELPDSEELARSLRLLGLGPEELTIAGLDGEDATTFLGSFLETLEGDALDLLAAHDSVASAQSSVAALERLIQSGQYDEDDLTALANARQALDQAESSFQSLKNGLISASETILGSEEESTLATLRAYAECETPTMYHVHPCTEAEWVELRDALANERIAETYEIEPDEDAGAVLTDWRSLQAVITADLNLQANLASVEAAWNAAIAGE